MRKLILALALIAAVLSVSAQDADSIAHLKALHERWASVNKYTPEKIGEELNDYAEAYSDLISIDTIGYSVEKRPLLMVKMGNGKHNIFALGTIHGREYISSALLMKNIEHIALSHASGGYFGEYDMKAILDSCTFYIVPMMNPDGADISQRGATGRSDDFKKIPIEAEHRQLGYKTWKANANGVDLNRNFTAGWENNHRSPSHPNSDEYKGVKPESEPETIALIDILSEVEPEAVLSYHTQGEILYISDPNPKAKRLGKEISRITKYPRKPAGRPYGSLQDHVDDEHGVFYVCVELCPYIGPIPYPDNMFYERVWPRARYVLPLAGAIMGNVR